jgi:hypothetical protein
MYKSPDSRLANTLCDPPSPKFAGLGITIYRYQTKILCDSLRALTRPRKNGIKMSENASG